MSNLKTIIYAISTLSGTIIGVGLFSLPYIASKVGLPVMLAYFLVLGILVTIVHMFFGELALKTPDYKRLPGFAKIYLGDVGRSVALISMILGLLGAVLAYLIVGGEFLANFFQPFFGGSNLGYTFLYFLLGAIFIFFDIKAVSKIEFWGLVLFVVILGIIFAAGFPAIKLENFSLVAMKTEIDFNNLFLPYGAILFSLWGAALIPEVEEMLQGKKGLLKKIIPISIFIPILIYLFFVFFVLGVTGLETTLSALPGLKNFLNSTIVSLGLFFGVLTTFTSFIALGLTLKKVFWYDLKIEKNVSWGIACFLPLALFLIGIKDFIGVISFVGGIMLGIDGILILLMYSKIRPERKSLLYPLALVFVLGIFYEIIYFTGR